MCNEALKQVGIVDHTGHQLAGLLVFVITQRQALQMLVNKFARVRNHAPAGQVSGVRADELHHSPGDKD